MELRDFAERVLFGTTIEEKLLLSPKEITDTSPGKKLLHIEQPGRPENLKMSAPEARSSFPGLKNLEKDHERGKLLHFLANHELLATELMALVLLKFPDAPKAFRLGVFQTLKEEQAHTLMYMRRMKECGIEFGSLGLNDYFWRMVSPMQEPLDFVSRLSLTFEQANLDFSKHYAGLFRQVGDTSTANVLEKIYLDEIDHVGHGLKWFKKWKKAELSDWNAYKTQLNFPLVPAKAKGVAPFNKEGRIAAGLDEDFIKHLQVEEGSRGRTPTILYFNPNAEGYAAANAAEFKGKSFTPKKAEQALQRDLEVLPLAWARKDDVVLISQLPSIKHLNYLKNAELPLPEWVSSFDQLKDRKLGKFSPWAWSPDASKFLQPYAKISTFSEENGGWRAPLKSEAFAKSLGYNFLKNIQPEEEGFLCESLESVKAAVTQLDSDVLMKAPFSSAGRGHRHYLIEEGWVKPVERWVINTLESQGSIIVEPLLARVFDFSAQYEVLPDRSVKLIGMTRVVNDAGGRYLGTFVHKKWASGLSSELTEWLFREQKVVELYKYTLIEKLAELMQSIDYVGPFGIDALVYKDAGEWRLRSCVEINTRLTMGRVSLELQKKTRAKAGFFQILRLSQLGGSFSTWLEEANAAIPAPTAKYGSIALNDPELASDFIAIWHARNTWDELNFH